MPAMYSSIENRGEQEKQQTSANNAEKDTVVVYSPTVDEPVDTTVNTEDVNVGQTPTSLTVNPKPATSYANLFTAGPSRKVMNFRTLFTPEGNGVDVVVPVESVRAICARFANTVSGFFLGKHVAYPVVANYVQNTWGKYGLVKSMLNSSTGIFSFQFSSMDGLDAMLENGPWFIRNSPLILKKWNPNVNLLKEDVGNVPVSSYARAMIEVQTDVKLKDTIVVTMPKLTGEGFYTCNVRVEYEWKPPKCACCMVFGHVLDECPKNIDSDVVKNMKKPSQTLKGVPVGPKVVFKPVKQVYRQATRKNNVNTNGNKKKDAKPTIEVNNLNLFDVLNSVENGVDLGTNGGSLNMTSSKANTSGFLSGKVESSSTSNTFMVDKIDKMKRLIIEGKDEVASTDNDMANCLASKKDGYGNNSLLEQWKESYMNGDYGFDPYDDDMYEG
ncbi:retrotransposon protein, putative, ty1-copia subclass [Tanacetum coccineum]|uniref:Retrotransposon protein, putative, ty1-copia subclass n=1 Tax=Tanacetum coccineum TaxID=301880 RepID=A0ABQ5IEV7_9ASTR